MTGIPTAAPTAIEPGVCENQEIRSGSFNCLTAGAMDFAKSYRFSRGFAFRREAFGGILYHYEGVRPDPRISFVDSPFLIDLLERLEGRPLDELIGAVAERFTLAEAQVVAIRNFFRTLHQRGALVVDPA